MVDDPNSLGSAMICHFILQKTKGNMKSMKQYSAQSVIDLVQKRRMQTQILRQYEAELTAIEPANQAPITTIVIDPRKK